MTRRPLTRAGHLLTVLVALLLVLSGCTSRQTRAEVTIGAPRDGQVLVLVTDQAQTVGTTAGDEVFSQALSSASIPAEVKTSSDAAEQLEQLLAQPPGPGIVVIQPWPDARVSSQLRRMREAGTTVLVVLNRPSSPDDADLVIGWDEFGAGERQFATLLQAMQQQWPPGPPPQDFYNVEHTAGNVDGQADRLRFTGTMWALKPYAKRGEVVTKSGQTSWSQVTTPDDDQTLLAKRLATTLEATYPVQPLSGVITGSPAEADTVRTATQGLQRRPVIVTDGATVESVTQLHRGDLAGIVYRDPARIVQATVDALTAIRSGEPVVVNPHIAGHNKLHTLFVRTPALMVTPDVLTPGNAADLLQGNAELSRALR
ncbi:substrate-binding domain-containing protein [Aestuariimicrobium ganziense]|uniref:substrate-binding domain-containing protein n=1 Tax=Aestuariimicrobium ganziense TaxID=2773677 RepID=UPI001942E7AC|nr:substrate-binding domain-containing protein [Aestuariimicrobium ganziense]